MTAIDGRTMLEQLTPPECWRLLASTPVGHVGLIIDSAPQILPVNHWVADRTVVFRTAPGEKLRSIERNPTICYEVDDLDLEDETGWSVLVKGRAERIAETVELGKVVPGWTRGDKRHFIRLQPVEITGRRVNHRRD